jgi:hypothetical protein
MDSDTRALTCRKRGDSSIPDKSGVLIMHGPVWGRSWCNGDFATLGNWLHYWSQGAFIDTHSTDERRRSGFPVMRDSVLSGVRAS